MKNKPVKSSDLKPETIPSLKKEIAGLKEDINKAQRKILKQETTILTAKNRAAKAIHRLSILQEKYDRLKKKINAPLDPAQLHADVAAIKGLKHNKPPIK